MKVRNVFVCGGEIEIPHDDFFRFGVRGKEFSEIAEIGFVDTFLLSKHCVELLPLLGVRGVHAFRFNGNVQLEDEDVILLALD